MNIQELKEKGSEKLITELKSLVLKMQARRRQEIYFVI